MVAFSSSADTDIFFRLHSNWWCARAYLLRFHTSRDPNIFSPEKWTNPKPISFFRLVRAVSRRWIRVVKVHVSTRVAAIRAQFISREVLLLCKRSYAHIFVLNFLIRVFVVQMDLYVPGTGTWTNRKSRQFTSILTLTTGLIYWLPIFAWCQTLWISYYIGKLVAASQVRVRHYLSPKLRLNWDSYRIGGIKFQFSLFSFSFFFLFRLSISP